MKYKILRDGETKKIYIDVLLEERAYYMKHDIPLTIAETLMLQHNAATKKHFTLNEAKECLEEIGFDYEKDVKKVAEIRVQDKGVHSIKCDNCGHYSAWHLCKDTCCDSQCDCPGFHFPGRPS